MIKYSVIVPVYNAKDYLPKCIESILDQTFPQDDYELVFVDDGSTDASGRICDEYAGRFGNRRVIHKDNEGLLLARGTGVVNSSGNYILFVDSDDYIENTLLSKADEYIRQYEPDILSFGFVTQSGNRTAYEPITPDGCRVLNRKEYLSLFVSSDRYNSVCNKVIRADILRDHSDEIYQGRINMGEDKLQTAFIIRRSDRIVLISDCLYHYIIRGTSMVHYKSKQDIFDTIKLYNNVEKIVTDIMDDIDLPASEAKSLLDKYRGVVINSTLEHIFKYNKRPDISRDEKFRSLREILNTNMAFFNAGSDVVMRLKCYNVVRYRLFVHHRLKSLLLVDRILYSIQKVGHIR